MTSTTSLTHTRHSIRSDDALLHTDLFLPPGAERVPVLLLRTMYDATSHHSEAAAWAERGIGMLVQDVRGRYRSSGEWRPYAHERADGYVTAQWLSEHPRADRIIAQGGSYSAGCALAIADHPAVSTVISMVPATGLAATIHGDDEILRLRSHTGWWAEHGERPRSVPGAIDRALASDPGLLATLPVAAIGSRLGLQSWDEAARARDNLVDATVFDGLDTPTLNLGGWWDLFTAASWRHANGARRGSAVIGPWGHDLNNATPVGILGRDERADLSLGEIQLDWIRHLDEHESTPSRLWVGGERGWLTGPYRTSPLTIDLSDCRSTKAPTRRTADISCAPQRPLVAESLTPTDIATDADLPDVTRLTTAPLERELALCGECVVTLQTDMNRPGATTDLVVRLSESTPDGIVVPFAFGFAEVRAVAGTYQVRCRPTGWSVSAGSAIAIDISGTLFPYLARNPQNGQPRLDATSLETLPRQLLLDGSSIALPVVTA